MSITNEYYSGRGCRLMTEPGPFFSKEQPALLRGMGRVPGRVQRFTAKVLNRFLRDSSIGA
jgi:hypothetical protein